MKWLAAAAAAAAIAYLLAQIYGDVTGNHKLTEKLEQTVPTVKDLQGINRTITNIKQKVAVLPTALPTPVNKTTVVKGAPGRPGEVVTAPPKTIVIVTPGPARTVRPTPAPTCGTSLLGKCVVP